MINRILAVGDSFTFGEELDNREQDCYVQQLADQIGAQSVTNLARPGSGNKRMVRNVIEELASGKPYDLVVIGWSSPGRMEFADAQGTYDLWPGYGGALFRHDHQDWRLELLDYINKYHDPEYLYKHYFLFDALMLQSYLKSSGVKYLMLTTVANEYYHKTFAPRLKPFVSQIDANQFVGWPDAGMAEWTPKCKRGPNGHFLEEGHKQVADKLYEHIRHLGWVS